MSAKLDAFLTNLNASIATHKDSHLGAALHALHAVVERDRTVISGNEHDSIKRLLSTLSVVAAFHTAALEALRSGVADNDDGSLEALIFELFDLLASSKR